MAKTIIDELVVTLGLDPTQFNKGQKDAAEAFLKTKKAVQATGNEIEERTKKMAEYFSTLRGQVLGLFAVFTAGKGIKEFVQDTVNLFSGVGRLAYQLDQSAQSLTKWRQGVVLMGGSADEASGTIQSLVSDFQQFQLTGQSAVVPYLRALGVGFVDANGQLKSMDSLLEDLHNRFQSMDPAKATAMMNAMGFSSSMINLMLLRNEAFKQTMDTASRFAPSDADIKAYQDLQKSWAQLEQTSSGLGRSFLNDLAPGLSDVMSGFNSLATWAADNGPVVNAVLGALAGAVIALSVAITASLVSSALAALVAMITPVGIVVTAVGVLAGIGYELYKNWSGIGAWWRSLWSGMSQDTSNSINNIGSNLGTAASSAQSDIQKLQQMGWSREQAAGILANVQAESGGNASAVGDSGRAYGLAQWHPDRQADFARWAGHDIKTSTRDEQLAFMNYELRSGKEQAAGRALGRARSAGEAGSIVSNLYERPGAFGAASKRAALASSIAGSGASMASRISNSSRIFNNNASNETNIGTLVVNTQASDAVGISQTIKPAIQRNSFAAQANYGAS